MPSTAFDGTSTGFEGIIRICDAARVDEVHDLAVDCPPEYGTGSCRIDLVTMRVVREKVDFRVNDGNRSTESTADVVNKPLQFGRHCGHGTRTTPQLDNCAIRRLQG
jgi:hypothetical protein